MASTDYIPHELLESLLEMVRMTDDVDVLKESTLWLLDQLLEADLTRQIGASLYAHAETRTTQRNGTRRGEASSTGVRSLPHLPVLEVYACRTRAWVLTHQAPFYRATKLAKDAASLSFCSVEIPNCENLRMADLAVPQKAVCALW